MTIIRCKAKDLPKAITDTWKGGQGMTEYAANHTPGPWRACYSETDEFGGGNVRSDHHVDGTEALLFDAGPMFHDYEVDREEELANLHLVASAPELLEALEALLIEKSGEVNDSLPSLGDIQIDGLEPEEERYEWTRFADADPSGNWHRAKQAIAKAKGGG
jgi:hypothetical protein